MTLKVLSQIIGTALIDLLYLCLLLTRNLRHAVKQLQKRASRNNPPRS